MTGKDLRCPKCGSPAVDVAPTYEIGEREAVSFRCAEKHYCIAGWNEFMERYECIQFPEQKPPEEKRP